MKFDRSQILGKGIGLDHRNTATSWLLNNCGILTRRSLRGRELPLAVVQKAVRVSPYYQVQVRDFVSDLFVFLISRMTQPNYYVNPFTCRKRFYVYIIFVNSLIPLLLAS